MTNETAIFWIDGDRYVFKDDEIDEVLRRAENASTVNNAWLRTKEYGEKKQ